MGLSGGTFTPEKLVIGVLSSAPELHGELERAFTGLYGEIEEVSGPHAFDFTTYYDKEMGPGIKRYFFLFSQLVSPERLARIKCETNELERRFARDGRRRINIDPGLLGRERFVLATTKDRGHRIPLQEGIFGEVTLIYMNGGFQLLPWTYPDYQSEGYRTYLEEVRTAYLKRLREDSGLKK